MSFNIACGTESLKESLYKLVKIYIYIFFKNLNKICLQSWNILPWTLEDIGMNSLVFGNNWCNELGSSFLRYTQWMLRAGKWTEEMDSSPCSSFVTSQSLPYSTLILNTCWICSSSAFSLIYHDNLLAVLMLQC